MIDAPRRGGMHGFVVRNKKSLAAGGAGSAAVAIALSVSYVLPTHEATKLRAYRDAVGVWTACTGETKGVRPGQTFTKQQCAEKLAARTREFNAGVERCVHRPMTVGVRIAFIDTAYNIGIGGFCSSSIVRLYNEGKTRQACDAIGRYVYARGRWLKGLANRRKDVIEICYAGIPG